MNWILSVFLFFTMSGIASEPKTYVTKLSKEVHHKGLKPHKHLKTWSHKTLSAKAPVAIPDSVDLRTKQLSPILDQGQCGSCYVHSAVSTLWDNLKLAGKDPGPLSRQYPLDCSQTDNGCNGGYFDIFDTVSSPKGDPSDSSYPYKAVQGSCQTKPAVASLVSWHLLGDEYNGPTTGDLVTYLSQNKRPISITMAAGAGDFEYYTSGIYNGCTQAPPDHMVQLVGYGLEGGKLRSNGWLTPGKGYYIVRNSWSAGWGEAGYFRIRITDKKGVRCNAIASEAAVIEVKP